ncbi:MAG: phospho-N-acetylmuramoyl-pentapeptide-transferase [Bacteroidales bacterium]|jgi:phospho-N-acetylmuramoyl-pentapeptide-transferase|nr:phospho-N-acetylmuramoyl-pentapeptide-transferase [Bacteroidales bacterium]MBO7256221.1 phospho-N-acetylmuramoyl-pentapeptide-transferase [Bacteroidales bacterium]MBO7284556.1 phospho-N-acetylmuramoyl-pentapeptide-transferase [Bacteroidales bacterium]MBO7323577.1 phospho-N-acetylmuramoyl-pentapeptide-transferase [Bacteroidales bacterium]MBQ1279593.1 phospho-N-acetylmuramoyl-pentapeptide-transferase [Bacteroidales bacterium]
MIYHLFEHFKYVDFPGAGIMQYISVRSILASVLAILISLIIGNTIIKFLKRKQIADDIRDIGLQDQTSKKGTPTMGGIIILLSIFIPVILFGDLSNVYIQLLLLTLVWLGALGFADDYIKVFKKNKEGLSGKYKIIAQIMLGLAVGITIAVQEDHLNTLTTIPFIKNNEFDYAWLAFGSGITKEIIQVIIYVIVITFIITGVSNSANLTDGLDGLAAGVSAIVGATLGVLAYLSGNVIYSDYLNIMFIPGADEIVVFLAAMVGGLLGFLWYNSYPAQVFMGDTGSLALGGIIGVAAVLIRKELLLPILCGVFFAEAASVIIQRTYYKYTRKKYGEPRRVFMSSPLHHHFQKPDGVKGMVKFVPKYKMHEVKITNRFWLISIILAFITLITLKIR